MYQIKFVGLLAALLLFAGCADDGRPPRYPVSGTLKLKDGTSLEDVTVLFRSIDGDQTARARVLTDGTFRLTTFDKYDGAVAGAHRVQVMPMRNPDGSFVIPVHPKYLNYIKSKLQYEVKPEEDNHFDIVIELR